MLDTNMEWSVLLTLIHIVYLISTPVVSQTFETCPQPSIKNQVAIANGCQPTNKFHCLYDNINKRFSVHCFSPKRLPAGGYALLEGSLNSRTCPKDRYQPQPFLSSDLNECIYRKSNCNGEGQVVVQDGTIFKDRLCRCDYRKGYDFLYRPRNVCYCEPSVEDCTCYIKKCNGKTSALTPDYKCESSGGLAACLVIPPSVIYDGETDITPEVHSSPVLSRMNYNISSEKGGSNVVLLVMLIVTIAFIIIVTIVILVKEYIDRNKGLTFEEVSALANINLATSDECFVKPEFFSSLESTIKKFHFLILHGRKGLGKKTLAYHLANGYLKKLYSCVLLTPDQLNKNCFYPVQKEKYFVIISIESLPSRTELENLAFQLKHFVRFKGEIKLVITCTIFNEIKDILIKNMGDRVNLEDIVNNIKYTAADKSKILNCYLEIYMRRNKGSEGRMDKTIFQEIMSSETYFGFPFMCSEFCSDVRIFKQGQNYFRQPHDILVKEIGDILIRGRSDVISAYIYYILLNIALYKTKLAHSELDYKQVQKFLSQVFSINKQFDDRIFSEACKLACMTYIKCNEDGNYVLQHPSIGDAVIITYGAQLEVIREYNLESLLLLVRPTHYQQEKGESCVTLPYENREQIEKQYSQRLVSYMLQSANNAIMIATYLKEYSTKYNDKGLLRCVFKTLMQSPVLKEDNIDKILSFFQEWGSDLLLCDFLENDLHLFIASWQFVCASKAKDRSFMESIAEDIIKLGLASQLLLYRSDKFGNTMLHYFCLWGQEREQIILLKLIKSINCKFYPLVKNEKNQTPLHFASYLGRHEIVAVLLQYYVKSSKFFKSSTIVTNAEAGQKYATKSLDVCDIQIDFELELCRDTPRFGSSTQYMAILNEIDKQVFKSK